MQDVRGDVGPEFPKGIREGVPPDGKSILAGDPPKGSRLAGVIRQRDTLSDAPAQQFRSIEAVVSVIVRSNDDARGRIYNSLQDAAFAHGVISFVLMKDGRQGEDDKIVAIRLIDVPSPIISPKAGHALAELLVGIRCLGQKRCYPHEDKCRIVETVPGGDDKGLPGRRGRRNLPGADRTEIGHDTEDSRGLRWRLGLLAFSRFCGWLLITSRPRCPGLRRLRIFRRALLVECGKGGEFRQCWRNSKSTALLSKPAGGDREQRGRKEAEPVRTSRPSELTAECTWAESSRRYPPLIEITCNFREFALSKTILHADISLVKIFRGSEFWRDIHEAG